MKLRSTRRADRDYADLPVAVRRSLGKQFGFLLGNLGHCSLQTKEYAEALDAWQANVS